MILDKKIQKIQKWNITIGWYNMTEFIFIAYCEKVGDKYMKQEYTVKEVFDKNSKTIDKKLEEVFISFLIQKLNK